MKHREKLQRLGQRYTAGLRKYLTDEREAALEEAYKLGRATVAAGLGILDLARVHQEAREKLLAADPGRKSRDLFSKLAGAFFLQSLSPFEATHRGFRETNTELLKRNEELAAEIAERQRVLKALCESEHRYRRLIETANDVIFSLTPDGRFAALNRAFEKITGWPRSVWLGKPFVPLIHPEETKVAVERFRSVLAGKPPEVWQYRIRKADGDYLVGEITLAREIKDGKPAGVFGIGRDVTERKRAEEALRSSEERLRAILDNSPAVIFLKDTRGRYLHVNGQFERQFRLIRRQVVGRTDREIFPRAQAALFQSHDRKVLREGVPLGFEETARYHDGVHTSIVSKFPLRDAKGKIYALCGIATDITARKRAEEALRLSEERFRLLVSNVRNYAIFLLDPDGRVASWNAGAERINGYRADEIIGRHFSCFYLPHEVRDGKPQRGLDIARRQGRSEDEGWRLRKDGTPFWASAIITPVRDESGRLRWFAKVVRDMTERKRFEESLQDLSRKILHAQEEERQRISRELHDEVGQSLTAISVTLAALRNNGAAKAENLSRFIAGTQRLLEGTMETVHHFARELRPAMLDELGLLPALRSHVKSFAERTGLRVRLQADPVAEKLNAEQKTAVFRITQESLTNVAKHARASRVNVFLRRTGDGICLEIADNGKSFRADPATAAKQKQRLGLLGMQERVRLVNGRFGIQPEPGRGTTVRVTIPFSPVTAQN